MADIKKQQELAAELSSKLWAMANDLRGNMEAYGSKIISLVCSFISSFQTVQKNLLRNFCRKITQHLKQLGKMKNTKKLS